LASGIHELRYSDQSGATAQAFITQVEQILTAASPLAPVRFLADGSTVTHFESGLQTEALSRIYELRSRFGSTLQLRGATLALPVEARFASDQQEYRGNLMSMGAVILVYLCGDTHHRLFQPDQREAALAWLLGPTASSESWTEQ
jgi:hypothetical protein